MAELEELEKKSKELAEKLSVMESKEEECFNAMVSASKIIIEESIKDITGDIVKNQPEVTNKIGKDALTALKQKMNDSIEVAKESIDLELEIFKLSALWKKFEDSLKYSYRGEYSSYDVMLAITKVLGKKIGIMGMILEDQGYNLNKGNSDRTRNKQWEYEYDDKGKHYTYEGLHHFEIESREGFKEYIKLFIDSKQINNNLIKVNESIEVMRTGDMWDSL